MKKLFALTIVLLCGYSFAQNNESTVTVNGSNNSATVNQTGADNDNILNQTSNNTFTLQQTGNTNLSKLNQTSPGSNEAFVEQLGNNNILARGGNLAIQGNDNLLDLLQQGNNNEVNFYQDARVQSAWIDQIGDFNKVKVSQDSYGNTTDIDQVGSYNYTNVKQDNGIVGNTSISSVTGSFNGDGTTGDLWLDIIQLGSGNKASTTIEGDYNDADVKQTGDNHRSTIDIYISSLYNIVDVIQDGGNSSRSTVRIGAGESNDVDITQTGNSHRSIIQIISNSDQNDVDVLQYGGNDNRSLWVMTGGSFDNTLDVEQNGNGNRATGKIVGDFNEVDVKQQGDDNFVGTMWNAQDGVAITGDNNFVDVDQIGTGHSSLNTITGNGNNVTVNQSN